MRGEYGVLDESWLIGIVASLTPAKDHASFLQAASIVRAEVPGTKFLLVGDGPLRSELMRRAAVLGLNGSVIFAGHQMRVAPYIGAMDVAVLSSCDQEGCSNFLLEAMGLGRPIVATDVGSNQELFPGGEAGLIVPPGNPLILAHAILEVMRHPDAAERMQRRSREIFRQRFTLPTMIAEYEDLYADLWRAYEPDQPPAAETERAA
jgi:glycosyltransferase involved in cell wall biosynthesis